MDALVSRYPRKSLVTYLARIIRSEFSQLIKILSRRYGLASYLIASTPERGTTGKVMPNYCHVSDFRAIY